ncbi:MAG: sugar transferase [Schleiferiaceae bacterium]|nr:sugar transferase [Schleiferiaceae bacterium]
MLLLVLLSLPFQLFTIGVLLFYLRPGQLLFRQNRAGQEGSSFVLYKWRSLLPPSAQTNSATRMLRRLSLDELPQLINVLKGEMNLVGPRPLLPEYLSQYSSYQFQRQAVKPGITGLAQVRGRNNLSWRHQFRYDVFYVKHRSWRLDLWILGQTVLKILRPSSGETAQRGAFSQKH